MKRGWERLLVGRRLAGRYELAEVVGSGGMSVVFRGRDDRLGRDVAVKVVSLAGAGPEAERELRARLRREASAAASIPIHPNVVPVHDFGTDEELDLDFIVMELLRGRDLKAVLADGAPPVAAALRILRDAARGVAAGHRAGLVHRDVKPANVFLVGSGEGPVESVRILDFGIAKPLADLEEDLTRAGSLPHSPAYVSPEQLDDDADVGPPSDVFQLGLVGWELLTGERPYGDVDRERMRRGEDVPPPDHPAWNSAPAAARGAIERALRARPADRYADAASFAEAVAAAGVESGPLVVAPASQREESAPEAIGAGGASKAGVGAAAEETRWMEEADDEVMADPTHLAPPPHSAIRDGAADDRTALEPTAHVGHAEMAVSEESLHRVDHPPHAVGRRGDSRGAWAGGALLLLLVAVVGWFLTRPGDAPADASTSDEAFAEEWLPEGVDREAVREELDGRFLRLQAEASERLEERGGG